MLNEELRRVYGDPTIGHICSYTSMCVRVCVGAVYTRTHAGARTRLCMCACVDVCTHASVFGMVGLRIDNR